MGERNGREWEERGGWEDEDEATVRGEEGGGRIGGWGSVLFVQHSLSEFSWFVELILWTLEAALKMKIFGFGGRGGGTRGLQSQNDLV